MESVQRTNNAAVPAPTPQIPRLVAQRFPAYKRNASHESKVLGQQFDKKMKHKERTIGTNNICSGSKCDVR